MDTVKYTCEHQGCGGCLYLGTPYEEQLNIKETLVRNLLDSAGIVPGEFLGVKGSPVITAYRNKMDYTFGDEYKGGPITLGMHKYKSFMSIITTDRCLLVDDDFNRILSSVLSFAKSKGYTAYNKKSHQGFLRNLVLRRGVKTEEILINLVTTSETDLGATGFVEMINGLELRLCLKGVLHTVYDGLADFVYCDELRVLYGEDYYMEKVLGLDFKINAFSFFQTNVPATESLYKTAISWIDIYKKRVLDLYCGAGVITLILLDEQRKLTMGGGALTEDRLNNGSGSVTGVELSAEAVRDAKENASINNLNNCNFIQGDVLEVIDSMREDPPDVIVVDPPRVGIHPKALKKIMALGAKEIVYISCNPRSLADNLKTLSEVYEVLRVQPFDNFPFTKHVETIALLKHRFG